MKWLDVAMTHRAWTGIALLDDKVVSILCNAQKPGPHPDELGATRVVYYINGHSKTPGSRQLLAAVGTGEAVRVFEKLGRDEWCDRGAWTPVAVQQLPGGYTAITLRPIPQILEGDASTSGP